MSKIVLVQATPEELKALISESVKPLVDDIKANFKPKEPTTYLTRQDVADLLQINLTTLWNYTRKGTLTAYGIGSRVYYKRHEVESAIVEQPPATFNLMLEALQNLENDNNQIPNHAWEMVQKAIQKAIG